VRAEHLAFLALLAVACDRAPHAQISTTSAGAYEASLAAVADGFMAAWYDTRDGHAEIYVRQLDAEGRPVAPERRLTTGAADAYEADITPIEDGFIVGWYEKDKNGHLQPKLGAWGLDGASRWSKTLAAHGRNTVVRASGALVFVAWIEDEDEEHSGVWAAWHRADGAGLLAPRRVADAGRTTWNLNAAVDPDSTPGRPHAWIAFDAKAGTKSEEVFVAEVTATGDRVQQLTPDDGYASKYPDLALSPDRAALTWFDVKDGNEEIYLAVGDKATLTNAPLSAPTRVTDSSGHSIGAYLAWNGSRLGLAWCDDTPGNQELYFRAFDGDGRPEGEEATRVTVTAETSSIPAIKPWRRGFALLWNEYTPSRVEGHHGGTSQVVFRLVS
jgi:hypothetical protein